MVNKKQRVVWSTEAKQQLKAAYQFIRKDSVQNAEKVRNDIIAITRKLEKYPAKYTLDK